MEVKTINQSSNYIKFIAYLQVIGIILVVFGHSFHEYPDGDYGRSMLMYRMMYSFRMPLFMFVSGYLMVFTTFKKKGAYSPTPGKFAISKIKRLLLPFVTLTIITFVPRTLMSSMADDGISLCWDSFWRSFLYTGNMVIPFFWFLQASFTLLLVSYTVLWLSHKVKLPDVITYFIPFTIFLVLPMLEIEWTSFFSLGDAIRLGIYFTAGILYSRYCGRIDAIVPWQSIWFFIMCAVVWAALFFFTEKTSYITICSFVGILMCISTAKILEYRKITVFDHLTGANYMIFLLSWFFNVACQQVLSHYFSFPWWVYTILSLICGVYIPWLAYKYMCAHAENRFVKLTAVLLGQNIRRKKVK